jgi:hypothetical protein
MVARLLAVGLLAAVVGAVWAQPDTPPAAPPSESGTIVGGAPGERTQTPASGPPGAGVAGMPQHVLERTARYVARHGGVKGSCYGCASRYMRLLADALIIREFPGWSERWSVCVVAHESGFNPAALSPAGAVGLAQILPTAHPEFDRWRLADPVYGTRAFARLSQHGQARGPWQGQGYAC